MGKIIRRVVAILLTATAVLLAVLPAKEAEATSTHGEYEYDGATVAKYLGDDYEVAIPAWVNRVGKEAFEGNDKMTKLIIPDTVTTVDFGAFSNCTGLSTVKMSESVRTLGSSAFSGCTNLYSISVPASVREIGSGVFAGCPSLSSVPISPLNENYTSYDGVIYSSDGNKLVQYLAGRPSTTYEMPVSVRDIEEYAFWGANNLSRLSLAYGIKEIPEYAFANCKGLQHVTLPRSVQSIFAYAFEACDSLSYINIPDTVGYIDNRAFANTHGAIIRFIDANGNVVKSVNSDDVENYGSGTSGGAVVTGADYSDAALYNAPSAVDASSGVSGNATSAGTSGNVASAGTGDNAASTGNSTGFDPTVTAPLDEGDRPDTTSAGTGNTTGATNTNGTSNTNGAANTTGAANTNGTANSTGTNNTTGTGSAAGTTDAGGTTTANPDGTTTANPGGTTTAGSDTIATVNPDGTTTVNPGGTATPNTNGTAASDTNGTATTNPNATLDSVSPGTNTSTGTDATTGTQTGTDTGSTANTVTGTVPAIEGGGAALDTSTGSYTDPYATGGMYATPNDTSGLYNNGYYKASDSGTPPWNTQIESRDFEDNMTEYDLGGGKIINGSAVLRMSSDVPVRGFNLSNAEYEDGFGNTAGTYRRQSDNDVIGDVYAAYNGDGSDVKIPAGVKKVGDRAFYNNENLHSVKIPAGVTDIGEFAFARSGLDSVELPEGTKSLDYAAFYMCPNLTNIGIPQSVDRVSLGAFDGTPFLENWKQNGDGDYLVVGDGVLLSYKGEGDKVVVPEGIKHIGPAAFSGNSNLQGVILPGTVEDIGEEAFCDCINLKELILNDGVRHIEDRAFKNTGLRAVSIPSSVEDIGLSAFDNGGNLKTVIFNGNSVPNVSYDKSATRLSAKDLRTDAFEGVENAIVSSKCDLGSGTMFDPQYYGFDGQVYSISPDDDRSLILERCLTRPDLSGNVIINQNVNIAGDDYSIGHVKSDAFDSYRNWSKYYDNKPSNVIVNGEQSDELVSLLNSVSADVLGSAETEDAETEAPATQSEDVTTEETQPDTQETEEGDKSNITVSLNGSRFPTRGKAYANIPGDDSRYKLSITEDNTQKDKIDEAVFHNTGSFPQGDYVPLSVDMYDKSGTVPIHKLGNSKMEVTMPVPSGMESDEGIGVACLDDNGRLSPLASEIKDGPDGKDIKFVTGHCSAYVIYSRGHQTTAAYDENGNPIETVDETNAAASDFYMSGTWQSINKKVYGPLSAKWIIIFILLCAAGILAVYKPVKKTASKKKG